MTDHAPELLQLVQLENRDGVAWLWLNRPELGNAFDDRVIAKLSDIILHAAQDDSIRLLVLGGRGKHFSAGADFNWMQRMVDLSFRENVDDAMHLARLMQQLNDFPKPTIAMVNGAAYGGALGLICACDIAIAAANATFCLSEVRLGLIPAVISPYVVAAMGRRQAARYMLSAEVFNAESARALGVVHEVVEPEALNASVAAMAATLGSNGPRALVAVKQLLRDVSGKPLDHDLLQLTAERIAHIRVGEEGQEGLRAFLGKREPAWRNKEPASRIKEPAQRIKE